MGRILSEWLQNPKPLFGALDLLINKGIINPNDVELSFFGTEPSLILNLVESYKCKSITNCLPRVSFKDVPSILQRSCINLVLTNQGRNGILTTKVFEYLSVKRPVLCIPGDGGELDSLIIQTKSGFSCQNISEVAKILETWYSEWKATGTICCQSNAQAIANFSRIRQAEQLANIFNSIC